MLAAAAAYTVALGAGDAAAGRGAADAAAAELVLGVIESIDAACAKMLGLPATRGVSMCVCMRVRLSKILKER